MTLSLLLDMNISPAWATHLRKKDVQALHWSEVGDYNATDEAIMAYARAHGHVLMTHDLDFTHLLALTHASGPSVILLRKQSEMSESLILSRIIQAMVQHKLLLLSGALVVIDAARARVRTLPLHYAND